ncbi:TPA: SocA family protein [Bacillus cereus]|nr:SocA family protein [Bacillus cereus]HDW8010027.1 SocA family protein [Bacillus cereus]HDW8015127.1 SocA family protein [Bacillus cereus]HDW8019450.1 SocA family protein [Bacillus cereus]HDW8026541.1 SocA family protein [Bacillus cereus]
MMTVNAKMVAQYFLSRSTPNTDYSITHLKLQKLVYYAQAWHLALKEGKPLFEDRIEAWVHGPVCPEIYPVYKEYGYFEIPPAECPQEFNSTENKEKREVLEMVWNNYGKYDGKFLEALTHQELPWIEAREGYEEHESGSKEISEKAMENYYKNLN